MPNTGGPSFASGAEWSGQGIDGEAHPAKVATSSKEAATEKRCKE